MEYSIILKINNRQGLIARIALLLERRSFTISHMSIQSFRSSDLAEMKLVVNGSPARKSQILVQLQKLIDVIEVREEILENSLIREKIVMSYN
jgi:acetolactate synthase I/III small subunit